jgi:YD repeat-containing protein
VTTRKCPVWLCALFAISLFCASCICSAGQSCIVDSRSVVITSCTLAFGFESGDPLPPGSRCLCNGVSESFTTCFKPLCSKHANSCGPNASQPVCLATGNTFIVQADVKIPGLGNGLTLVRTWNSLLRLSLSSVGLFGPNWRSTYEEHIYVDDDDTVAYARGDGSVWNFVSSSGQTFTPVVPANSGASLLYGPTTWTLTFQNGERRVFDITSGNLLSIIDRNGNTTQLAYDASYRLVTVTDPASRHLYLSYASPTSYLVTGVSSDVGVSLSYSYDGQGRLIQYTKPDSTKISFQYNDPNTTLITAVLDANGKVLESHTYDNQARGLTSSRAGGVEAVTITYPPGAFALP